MRRIRIQWKKLPFRIVACLFVLTLTITVTSVWMSINYIHDWVTPLPADDPRGIATWGKRGPEWMFFEQTTVHIQIEKGGLRIQRNFEPLDETTDLESKGFHPGIGFAQAEKYPIDDPGLLAVFPASEKHYHFRSEGVELFSHTNPRHGNITRIWVVPFWPIPVLLGIWPLIRCLRAITLKRQLRNRSELGLCTYCGYDLRGLPLGRPCPECGSKPLIK